MEHISGKNVDLQRLTKNFESNVSKISVTYDSVPGFPGILVQWITPKVTCTQGILMAG